MCPGTCTLLVQHSDCASQTYFSRAGAYLVTWPSAEVFVNNDKDQICHGDQGDIACVSQSIERLEESDGRQDQNGDCNPEVPL